MSDLKAYILWRFARRSSLYTTWLDRLPIPFEIVKGFAPDWEVPDDAGILITHMHYRWEEVCALRKVHESGKVPVLILADGVLEYRNIWEHPDLADGCIFQPVVGHKLATIGRSQTDVIESWGNVGKCETVGLPRLDSIRAKEIPPISTEGPFRVLIATATTPAFNEHQREAVVESLLHIKNRLSVNSNVNGRPVEVTWRLTDGLAQTLEVGSPEDDEAETRRPLLEVIDENDAVITTPSTLYLESLLKKRPTAILDFHNTPHYVNAAWMIRAPKHFNDVIKELANPPAAKMLFQETVLKQQLLSDGKAADRLLDLIGKMVEEGANARQENRPVQLPHRILGDPLNGFPIVEHEFDLRSQYPDNAVFANEELKSVQLELNLAIKRMGEIPEEISTKTDLFTEMKEIRDELLIRLENALEQNRQIMALNEDLQGRNKHVLDLNQSLKTRNDELRERTKTMKERIEVLRTRVSDLRSKLQSALAKRDGAKKKEDPSLSPFSNDPIQKKDES